MAIIIHSSDIYEKTYTPLKDNTINSVEVPIKKVSITHEENVNVYSTSSIIDESELSTTSTYDDNSAQQPFKYATSQYYIERIYNEVNIKLKKITVNSFNIPKLRGNKKTINLTNNKIKFDFDTRVEFYDAYNDSGIGGQPITDAPKSSTTKNGLFVNDMDIDKTFNGYIGNINNGGYPNATVLTRLQIQNNHNENNIAFSVTSSGTFSGTEYSTTIQPITSSKVIAFEKEVAVQENDDYYIVPTFTVICGYRADLCYRWDESNQLEFPDDIPTEWAQRDSRIIRYNVTPMAINMNLDGDIITIALDEVVQTYGDTVNKKNSYKADGNELIQSTNTYNDSNAVDKFAQEIINQYSNGKETAVLLCSIGNYYDESGKLVIGTKQYRGSYSTLITFVGIRPFQGKYMIIFNGDITNNAYAVQYSNEQANVEKDQDLNYIIVDENSIFYRVYNENYSIIVNVLCEKLNRLFEVGDEVIPYTYTAYGEKPLSTYKNGNHKVYKVIGVQLIDEGICWQKLTIQEK